MKNILINNLIGFCIFFTIGYFARIICDFIIRKYKEFKIPNTIDKINYLFSLKRKYENKDTQFKDLIEREILDNIEYAYLSKHKELIEFVEKIKILVSSIEYKFDVNTILKINAKSICFDLTTLFLEGNSEYATINFRIKKFEVKRFLKDWKDFNDYNCISIKERKIMNYSGMYISKRCLKILEEEIKDNSTSSVNIEFINHKSLDIKKNDK